MKLNFKNCQKKNTLKLSSALEAQCDNINRMKQKPTTEHINYTIKTDLGLGKFDHNNRMILLSLIT
jgi:hypothetical protein